ncbi:hypothetical protein [Comamonas testosteroni]|uniref:hypothetical protein n=1 Tax=Comamonas testosteroni TaxID=285 RepID=UPI000B1A64BC|nr:hypothetical protein [Comamonas testosteroni]
MQDKITIADAPDCLNTNDRAMWVLGYQAALAARSTCLYQIQVPSVAEQAAWHAGLDEGRAQAGFTVSNAEAPQAAPAAVAVPDGLKLVPVDLTPEMKREFMDLLMDGIDIYVNRRDQIEIQTDAPRRIWKAVLALAPSAPADALATATGLPAQAVEMPDFDLRTSKGARADNVRQPAQCHTGPVRCVRGVRRLQG